MLWKQLTRRLGSGLKAIFENIDNRTDFKSYMQNYAVAKGTPRGPRREGPYDQGYVCFFFFFLPVHKLKIELTLLKAKGTASSCPTEQRCPRHIYYLPSARLSSTTTVASGPSILQLHSLSPILYTVATARFFSAIFTKFPLPQLIHYIHRYCKHQ